VSDNVDHDPRAAAQELAILSGENTGGGLTEFRPEQTRMKVGAIRGAIGHAKKIKDWPSLERAINELIDEQRGFVAWWQANVTPSHGAGRGKKNAAAHCFSVRDATDQTGISQPQVSRWKRHLEDEAGYRETLRESIHAHAWALRDNVNGTQGTGEFERYTPEKYIEVVRRVLGEIDLDPASCDIAQRTVRATNYFTEKDNGLNQEWYGRVFLNSPYLRKLIGLFVTKLVGELRAGRTTAAIMLSNNSTDTEWFREASEACKAICFTTGRIRFAEPNGQDARLMNSVPTTGQAFLFFGGDTETFLREFHAVGLCFVPAYGGTCLAP
jgi:hypothetical protein